MTAEVAATDAGITRGVARTTGEDHGVRTYYGRPVVKEPAWTWEVPWYLFFGGMAGASSVLAVAAAVSGNTVLAQRTRAIAALGAAVSPPLLIADLGRPTRFLHMLRVFRPTSVMSVGSWILASYAATAIGTAGLAALGRGPRLRAVGDGVGGVLGLGMATYTGALVADTSIPAWHEARRELPLLFAASGLASAGAAALLVTPTAHAAPACRVTVVAAAAELAIDRRMRERLGELGDVYEQGPAGALHRAAEVATSVGATLVALGRGRRRRTRTAGALALLAGGICQRWAVYRAGFQSARDPVATVKPQRQRLARGEGYRRP